MREGGLFLIIYMSIFLWFILSLVTEAEAPLKLADCVLYGQITCGLGLLG